jgi:hypothetical protein
MISTSVLPPTILSFQRIHYATAEKLHLRGGQFGGSAAQRARSRPEARWLCYLPKHLMANGQQ